MAKFVVEQDGRTYEVEAVDFGTAKQAVISNIKPKNEKMEEQMGVGGRFMEGVVDPVYGARQLYNHVAGSDEDAAKIDQEIDKREDTIKRKSGVTGTDYVRMGGRMVPAVALSAAGGPIGEAIAGTGVAGGALGGALTGTVDSLLSPTTGGNYAQQKFEQALFGTAFGGLGAGGTKAIGSTISPTVREAAKALMDRGIELTPGQIAGGILRRGEEAAKSFPILGTFIRGAETRSVESFNRAAIDQALEPLGIKLPTSAKPGHESISYAKLRLDDAYDNLLPKMHLGMDNDLASDIANTRFLASELPGEQAKQFDTIMQNRVAKYFADSGAITGDKLKSMESELNYIASTYRASSDAGQRQLGQRLDDMRFALRDALQRQNPQAAEALQKINSSYAMFTRLESAATRRAGSQGIFTPSDLLQAIKTTDKSVRKGAFARGDSLMQDFAEYADMVIPSRLSDSGTPERLAFRDMLGVGAGVVSPKIPIGLGAASLPYTKTGSKVVNSVMGEPGPIRQAIGQGVKRVAAPAGGVAAVPGITFTGD